MHDIQPDMHHRRSIRLKDYDYSRPGAYFITICTHNRECVFGEITGGKMALNEFGKIANQLWVDIGNRFPNVELDEFVIMPNHVHTILVFTTLVGAGFTPVRASANRATARVAPTLGQIVGAYKSRVSNECLKIYKSKNLYMGKLWQRNYYEHIIRDESDLNRIREYIMGNSLKWREDKYFV